MIIFLPEEVIITLYLLSSEFKKKRIYTYEYTYVLATCIPSKLSHRIFIFKTGELCFFAEYTLE